jgi:hypothetical protein
MTQKLNPYNRQPNADICMFYVVDLGRHDLSGTKFDEGKENYVEYT